mmetsp:Transcript_5168/g.16260  ORF Transcript_5168/g.16260 Transcript_5168/m.16260 type:complete len:212 (+) Transcript_5168:264-899(+)
MIVLQRTRVVARRRCGVDRRRQKQKRGQRRETSAGSSSTSSQTASSSSLLSQSGSVCSSDCQSESPWRLWYRLWPCCGRGSTSTSAQPGVRVLTSGSGSSSSSGGGVLSSGSWRLLSSSVVDGCSRVRRASSARWERAVDSVVEMPLSARRSSARSSGCCESLRTASWASARTNSSRAFSADMEPRTLRTSSRSSSGVGGGLGGLLVGGLA